jgi:uncharacterized protein
MSEETAKKAIMKYLESFKIIKKVNYSRIPVIGFYGGEPLLNFELIKTCVTFCKGIYNGNILFNITTNGYMLDDVEIQNFLSENDFSVTVSLDGDERNHNRNRIDQNGFYTFEKVYTNVKKFWSRNKNLKLSISACYDFSSSLTTLNDFFDKEDYPILRLSMVNPDNTSYYDRFSQEEINRFNEEIQRLNNIFFDQIKKQNFKLNSFLGYLFAVPLMEFSFYPKLKQQTSGLLPCSSCCVPGEKIYVNTNGKFLVCERVCQDLVIGDVDMGIDLAKIEEILNRFKDLLGNRCGDCNVSRLCSVCFSNVSDKMSDKDMDLLCSKQKNNIRGALTEYVSILELRPDFFDRISGQYYSALKAMIGDCRK